MLIILHGAFIPLRDAGSTSLTILLERSNRFQVVHSLSQLIIGHKSK